MSPAQTNLHSNNTARVSIVVFVGPGRHAFVLLLEMDGRRRFVRMTCTYVLRTSLLVVRTACCVPVHVYVRTPCFDPACFDCLTCLPLLTNRTKRPQSNQPINQSWSRGDEADTTPATGRPTKPASSTSGSNTTAETGSPSAASSVPGEYVVSDLFVGDRRNFWPAKCR